MFTLPFFFLCANIKVVNYDKYSQVFPERAIERKSALLFWGGSFVLVFNPCLLARQLPAIPCPLGTSPASLNPASILLSFDSRSPRLHLRLYLPSDRSLALLYNPSFPPSWSMIYSACSFQFINPTGPALRPIHIYTSKIAEIKSNNQLPVSAFNHPQIILGTFVPQTTDLFSVFLPFSYVLNNC